MLIKETDKRGSEWRRLVCDRCLGSCARPGRIYPLPGYAHPGSLFILCWRCAGTQMTEEDYSEWLRTLQLRDQAVPRTWAPPPEDPAPGPAEKPVRPRRTWKYAYELCDKHAVPCPDWSEHDMFDLHQGDSVLEARKGWCCYYCCDMCKKRCSDPVTGQKR